jgi:sterol desaturase/sphingolipid hydroxylase (fatty acid hydroxylase superfamily)
LETWLLLQQRLPPLAFDALKFGNGLLLLCVLLVPLERLFALRRQPVWRPGLPTDLAYYFLSSLLPARLLAWPLAGLALALAWLLPAGWMGWSAALPWWLRFALAMVVAEIGFYWGHRWLHQHAWLWRLHAVHHSAEQLDWLVNTRAHPVDLVFTRACGIVPLYLLGLAQGGAGRLDSVPLLVSLLGSLWGYLVHANLRWRLGWLEHWVSSPAFHHWHHVRLGSDGRTHNYAALMPWVDKLFGSFHLPADWPERYGIDTPIEPGIAGQLLQPFMRQPEAAMAPDQGSVRR